MTSNLPNRTEQLAPNASEGTSLPSLGASLDRLSRIFLIGPRGSGKTTVAAVLAARLGWSHLDADAELERRYGRTIRAIFAEDGEPAFRDMEAAVLAELCQREKL